MHIKRGGECLKIKHEIHDIYIFFNGSFTSITSPFSNEPDVQRVQRERMEG